MTSVGRLPDVTSKIMIRNRKLARITADASYRQFNIKAIPLFQDKLITEAGLIKTISQYTRDSRGTNTLKKALESLHSLCRRENTRIHPESMQLREIL